MDEGAPRLGPIAGIAERKRALRAEVRERRAVMTATERERAEQGLTARLLDEVETAGARTVTCYLSTPFEPQTRAFVRGALARRVRVLLPVSRVDGLLDWVRAGRPGEQRGPHGMPEPVGEPLGTRAAEEADLMLIPACAVDDSGMRLGWGRGYFDKTLAAMRRYPPVLAVVFDGEVLASVPHEDHDRPVDGVVTPSRTIRFSPRLTRPRT